MMKILLVDDDRYILELIGFMLHKQGHDISAFSHVDEAMEALESGDTVFDLVITDIVMPGKTGIDFMKYLKLERGLKTPVLAITGGLENALDDYIDHAELYADMALAKPVAKDALVNAITRLTAAETALH